MTLSLWSIAEHEHGFVAEVENAKGERERLEIDWETAKWLQSRLGSGLRKQKKQSQEVKVIEMKDSWQS